MSWKIEGENIHLTRGDTFSCTITPQDDEGTPFEFREGDSYIFTVKRRYTDVNPLIRKDIDTETLELTLAPEDTASLPFGEYVYDVAINTADGDVFTVIPADPDSKAIFKLEKDV